MREDVQALVRLQEWDQAVHQLEVDLAELPRKLDALQKEGAAAARALEELGARRKAGDAERRKLENDVVLLQSKIAKLQKQMKEEQSGTLYQTFEHEIAWARQEIAKAEERELELLMNDDQLAGELAAGQSALGQKQKAFESERVAALARHKAGKAEIAALEEKRKATLAGVPAAVSGLYERLRKKHKNGIVAVECTGPQCPGCYMEIRPARWQELRAIPEPFMTCESCGRVMYVVHSGDLPGLH